MLYYILLFLLILNGLFLGVVVLLQSGKGGGLASMGGGMGTDTLIGGRQAATLLTKATWTGGGTFMALALILSIVSSRQRAPESILRDTFTPQQQTAPAPVLPGASTGATGATGGTAPQSTQQAPQTTPPSTTNR